MTIKVAIINYGIGNIRSLYNSLKKINVEAESNDGIGCSHTDNGEEVEYLVEVMLLDYKITPA